MTMGFVAQTVDPPNPEVQGFQMVDLDGDDDLDFLGGTFWRENTNGAGAFGVPISIDGSFHDRSVVLAADFDDDGDNDVVTSNGSWFENLGHGRFARESAVDGRSVVALAAVDLNGDGTLDLLAQEIDKLNRFEFDLDTRQFVQRDSWTISRSVYQAFDTADIDGDEDLDVLFVSPQDRLVAAENRGNGTFDSATMTLTDSFTAAPLLVDDVDGDTRLDILASVGEVVRRFEQVGESIAPVQDVALFAFTPFQISIGDINADGTKQVSVNSARGNVTLGVGPDGMLRTQPPPDLLSGRSAPRVVFADVDGDGADEVVSDVGWQFWDEPTHHPFVDFETPKHASSNSVVLDIDLDGDLDAVTAFSEDLGEQRYASQFRLHENVAGTLIRSVPLLDGVNGGVEDLISVDVDGDRYEDLVTGGRWFKNPGATQGDWESLPLPSGGPLRRFIDVDADGDADLFVRTSQQVELYENQSDAGTFALKQVFPQPSVGEERQINVADWDGDGDLDLLATSIVENKLAHGSIDLYKQQGDGSFGSRESLLNEDLVVNGDTIVSPPFSVGDIDEDGISDVVQLLQLEQDAFVVLNRGRDGVDEFHATQVLATLPVSGLTELSIVDIDGDDDLDISFHLAGIGFAGWLDNRGGEFVHHGFRPEESGQLGDVDQDGDLDFVTAGTWYETRLVGDVDGDNLRTTRDLVLAFRAGWYEFDAPNRATFETGDWNHDGRFDSGDLVLALSLGGFD